MDPMLRENARRGPMNDRMERSFDTTRWQLMGRVCVARRVDGRSGTRLRQRIDDRANAPVGKRAPSEPIRRAPRNPESTSSRPAPRATPSAHRNGRRAFAPEPWGAPRNAIQTVALAVAWGA